MVEIFYIEGVPEKIHPLCEYELQVVDGESISSEKSRVKLAPIGETIGKYSLEGRFTLRDENGFYDGNTRFTDRLAIQFARKLGELYGVNQVVIHANFSTGTQSYEFKYKFEMRKEDK